MPQPHHAAQGSRLTRRSRPSKTLTRRLRPAKTLTQPVPDKPALTQLLTAAARTPDCGTLEPWRFIVLNDRALARLAELATARGKALRVKPRRAAKVHAMFANADLSVVVVASYKPSRKIPKVEQVLSAGSVCLALMNAALAAGWGANWMTGWASRDRPFLSEGLGLADDEFVAGFIHIGTETTARPERPRPDLDIITSWVEA